jgi:hypothetical protein
MGLRQVAFGSCMLACLPATAACGSSAAQTAPAPVVPAAASSSCASRSGFELSLVTNRGRPASAGCRRRLVRLPRRRDRHPERGLAAGQPEWQRRDGGSGPVTLHVIQRPGRTWQVDSEQPVFLPCPAGPSGLPCVRTSIRLAKRQKGGEKTGRAAIKGRRLTPPPVWQRQRRLCGPPGLPAPRS